jgi:hypothetical protein
VAWSGSVRVHPERLTTLSVFHSELRLYGTFAWARRALNIVKRRFPAPAVVELQLGDGYEWQVALLEETDIAVNYGVDFVQTRGIDSEVDKLHTMESWYSCQTVRLLKPAGGWHVLSSAMQTVGLQSMSGPAWGG